jgi:hypothetical protein
MSLEDLGNIGDFVGGLLLAISLLYLATQIRQNTKSSRAEAYQDAVDKINNWSTLFVHEKSHSDLFYRGLKSHSSLEPEERSQFYHLMMIYLRSYAAAKHLEENNLLAKSVTEGYEGGLKDMFKEPEMLDWLSKHEHTIDSETVSQIRKIMRSKINEE